jgi:hypothetical protein
MQAAQTAEFKISPADAWRLANTAFDVAPPAPDLAKGGEWAVKRAFPSPPKISSLIDSAIEAKPWDLGVTPNHINVNIDPFGTLFIIKTNYTAVAGGLPKLDKPSLDFGPTLNAVRDIVNSLKQFIDLGFHFDVDVVAGNGPSPSFIIIITLNFRIGGGPNERIEIGVGKFYGEFLVRGELEAALSGSPRGRLTSEFQGDVQMGIIPPLIYAGGLFRFAIEIRDLGRPRVELGVGVTASIGGDLIKGLLELEVTVKYGYTLIPETLQPGVLLGLEARAKLLGGLVGFSFAVQAMARIQRADPKNVTIFADIRVVATVQIAWLIEEDIDMRTQFEQRIPLALAAIASGNLLAAAALV